MSKLHIKTTKTIMVNDVEYKTDINKIVNIDFSETNYAVKIWDDVCGNHNCEIELIPDNTDFLKEVIDIFPLTEYDIRIVQSLYNHTKPHISLWLDIRNKDSGEKIYFAEGVLLSDKDYNYIQYILGKEAPGYQWQTTDRFIRASIESYMCDCNWDDYFTDDASHFLSRMVSARYEELKTDRYIDFDADKVPIIAREILEDALRKAYDTQDEIGYWIIERNSYEEDIAYHCSKCYEKSGFTTTSADKFCPNCGKKMHPQPIISLS